MLNFVQLFIFVEFSRFFGKLSVYCLKKKIVIGEMMNGNMIFVYELIKCNLMVSLNNGSIIIFSGIIIIISIRIKMIFLFLKL